MKTVVYGMPMSHVALALSALCFIIALPAIFDPKKFRGAVEDFLNSGNSVIRIAGLFDLLIAFFILNTHWTIKLSSARSIMTVIGYLLFIKGVVRLWFPGFVREKARKFLQKDSSVYVIGFLGLVFAIGLGYLGWWVY